MWDKYGLLRYTNKNGIEHLVNFDNVLELRQNPGESGVTIVMQNGYKTFMNDVSIQDIVDFISEKVTERQANGAADDTEKR